MTREEFYEKYKDVDFYFSSYYKYTFTFIGEYEGEYISVGVGGHSDYIYRFEVCAGSPEKIHTLDPYEGMCGEDDFYDF